MMTTTDLKKQDDASVTSATTTSQASTTVADYESTKTPSSPSVVTKLSSNDVLMGRGAAVIGNEGNRRFRKLIQKYKAAYDATRIRQEKDRIARKIVDTIVRRSGRFLKKVENPAQVPAGKTAWVAVKEAVVLQKVKQAFRDDRRSFEDERKNDAEGIPAVLKAPVAPKATPVDSLLGDTSLVQASLLMRSAAANNNNQSGLSASPLLTALLSQQQQQPKTPSLDAQLLLLAAARQQQLMDDRATLLRQALLEQHQQHQQQQALAALSRQAALRELLGNSSRGSGDKQPPAMLASFLR